MTTTPTVWLPNFRANLAIEDTQIDPVIVGLANGNFLVSWQDINDTDAPGAGSDVVGAILDARGTVLRTPFQLNVFATDLNERDPSIVADASGGFVVVYVNAEGIESNILWDRYNAAGERTGGGFVVQDTSPTVGYIDPSVAIRADGSFVVTYERIEGQDLSVRATVVSAAGVVGEEIVLRADETPASAGADPRDPDSATLTNGVVVTAFLENDDEPDIEVRALNPNGTLGFAVGVNADEVIDSDPRVAALSGGGFVVTWTAANDVVGRVYNANGTAAGAQFAIAAGTDSQNEPDVIGLEDGGFFVVWDNDTEARLEGRRFDAAGTPVGGVVIIDIDDSTPGSPITTSDLSLTTDGRILVTWRNGEIFSAILDPREARITVQPGDGVTTARQDGSVVIGTAGADVLYGGAGNDRLYGGFRADFINGGAGNDIIEGGISFDDTIRGADGNDTIQAIGGGRIEGNAGNDVFFVVDGGALGGRATANTDRFDGGTGIDVFDASNETTSFFTINLENRSVNRGAFDPQNVALLNFENVVGSRGSDQIAGDGAANLLRGIGGNDTMSGYGGNDLIAGGAGNDRLFGNVGNDRIGGGLGNDFLSGGAGRDTLSGSDGVDTLSGGAGDDLLSGGRNDDGLYGGSGRDRLLGGAGNDLLLGRDDNDLLGGDSGNDLMGGDAGNDALYGGGGQDRLYGNSGADRLVGGDGGDLLNGGGGADDFVFRLATESTGAARDTIVDFTAGVDRIDLSAIDANPGLSGNQPFDFIGSAAFSGAGELRFATNGTDGFLLAQVDGAGAADIEIRLLGVTQLSESDLLL